MKFICNSKSETGDGKMVGFIQVKDEGQMQPGEIKLGHVPKDEYESYEFGKTYELILTESK